jgi:hypothetical protein
LLPRCARRVDQLQWDSWGCEFCINSSGVGGEQDEFVGAGRMLQRNGLGDESAQRPPHHARTLEAERLDHSQGVVGELVDIEWRSIIRGGANAAVVEQDELVS